MEALETLGYDNQEVLITARDKYLDEIDVTRRLEEIVNKEETEGTIVALYGEDIFH